MTSNPFSDDNELKRNQLEYRLQVAVVKHLQTTFPSLLWTHCPNRPADAQDGFFKKMMGVRPGVSDLLFWYSGGFAAIELKASKGRWGNDQNRFASSFTAIGGKFKLCKSVQEVHDALVSWGIVPASSAVTEPDLRSLNQKHSDSFNFYAWQDDV